MKKIIFTLTALVFCCLSAYSQQTKSFDLSSMVASNELVVEAPHSVTVLQDGDKKGVTCTGIAWIKGMDFKNGTVDIDLRGKNVFLKSFLGIAFHAKDTISYDVVYFCPFRFHDTDSVTRKYSVKYMSFPDYSFSKLRKEYPGVYENEANPAPQSDEWFHATIVIKDDWISVYVNHAATPSLKVKRLNTLPSGKIGLWSYAPTLSSDFANLVITTDK